MFLGMKRQDFLRILLLHVHVPFLHKDVCKTKPSQPLCFYTLQVGHRHASFQCVFGGSPELLTEFDGKLFEVASLEQKRFKWNGLPSIEFQENVVAHFKAGLMTVGPIHRAVAP